MGRQIPIPVMAVVADIFANRYSHTQIDNRMEAAGISYETLPLGNKVDKSRIWLGLANSGCADALAALGKIILEIMEVTHPEPTRDQDFYEPQRDRIQDTLNSYGLSYLRGGYIVALGSTPVGKTLQDIISTRDLAGLQTEFNRIYDNLESDPPTAVTASCALLESLFKSYIDENKLDMPADQTVKPLWKVIKKDLKFDPEIVDDDDLKTILTGLAAIVEGTGALRTHKGSAHGHGKANYKLKPRHARLAAHAAFTLASFVLEAWNERAPTKGLSTVPER